MKLMITVLRNKKTASISTGSWSSKQPGQVFDISKLTTVRVVIHSVERHWPGLT